MIKRSKVKKYFSKFPIWSFWLILLSFPLLPINGLGIAPLLIGIAALFSSLPPSDQEMDELIESDLDKLIPIALDKCDLDESELIGDAVLITGPRFRNLGGAEFGIKKGKDNTVRFTPLGVTVINFTPHQLVAYQCAMDLTTGNALSESTDEYFYKDVVSVSTQSNSVTLERSMLDPSSIKLLEPLMKEDKLQFNSAESFVLTTAGATTLEVFLKDPSLLISAGGGEIPTDKAQKAVKIVRRMLRDKKMA